MWSDWLRLSLIDDCALENSGLPFDSDPRTLLNFLLTCIILSWGHLSLPPQTIWYSELDTSHEVKGQPVEAVKKRKVAPESFTEHECIILCVHLKVYFSFVDIPDKKDSPQRIFWFWDKGITASISIS